MALGRVDVHPLPPFSPLTSPTTLSQRWSVWKKRFETYLAALNITDKSQKRALLLYQAGQETQEIFETFQDRGEPDDYDRAISKLDAYFSPKKNIDYEILQFRQAKQLTDETVDQFCLRLRKLAVSCEFHDAEKEIKAAVIQNCLSKRLRRVALREEQLSLEQLLAKARALETSEVQAAGIEESLASMRSSQDNSATINRTFSNRAKNGKPPSAARRTPHLCRQCGYSWPHKKSCPAQGKQCAKCGKNNHFAQVCRSRIAPRTRRSEKSNSATQVRHHTEVESTDNSSTDDEYLYTMAVKPAKKKESSKPPTAIIQINSVPVQMIIDSGASTNIIDETAYQQICKREKIAITKPTNKILAYGSEKPLPAMGQFRATLESKSNYTVATIHVIKGSHGSLLSYHTATELGLIELKVNQLKDKPPDIEQLAATYPNLFNGIGELKDFNLRLHIDHNVPPVAQPPRRIPFHLRKQVAKELKKLEQDGIIEDVKGPTPWISPLVIVPKPNGTVRLCVDMRRANQAIQRERHANPTVDDVIHSLNGATMFSKIDLKSGYHQIKLSEESRFITAFSTPKGVKQFTRLNFGTNSASEIFQHVISERLHGIPGVLNISDDILIYGKTPEEHHKSLNAVLQRLSQHGLTLNKDKCLLYQTKLAFFGFVFSSNGISADPQKVIAIKNASSPKSVKDVRTFLGMATYCAKFIQNFSDLTKPLRDLTKKNASFVWTAQHEAAFNKVKEALTSDTVMAYFDSQKQTELVTDASPWGLSAILSQKTPGKNDRRIVAYVSRSLSDVEKRYSQTEREALAIVWAIERLHIYLYGANFKLYTDCKPIELILGNRKSKPSARIERWNLRIQDYTFDVVFTKGIDNPSDFLSRHPTPSAEGKTENLADQYVNFISYHSVPKAMTLEQIKIATRQDVTLQKLVELIQNGNWYSINTPEFLETIDKTIDIADLKSFRNVKDELTVNSDSSIILRGSRIVIPRNLREQALNIAHEGHQGLIKTKQLLREKIWFPNIDKIAKQIIDKCLACQANSQPNPPEPVKMSSLPPGPWDTIHIDFCGPFPTGEYVLVAIDAYSKFPEVDIIHSTSAQATIPKLDRIFATHGIPRIIKTDNGPPFNSTEIAKFMEQNGIQHDRITPLWPQANSQAESFMKPITKAIKSAYCEQKNWKKEIYRFLLNYRSTPHCSTGYSPAELLFNRKINNKLPQQAPDLSNSRLHSQVVENDAKAKAVMKRNADTINCSKKSEISIGDVVLVKQQKRNKFSTRFSPTKYRVIARKGTMITAENSKGDTITRNISFFRKVTLSFDSNLNSSDDDDGYDGYDGIENQNIPEPRYPQRARTQTYRYGQNIYDR